MSAGANQLAAFKMFQDSLKDLQARQTINEATDMMHTVNLEIEDDFKRSQALQKVSNELAARLSGIGADPTRVAQAAQAIRGPQFDTPETAIMHGTMSGNKDMVKKGKNANRDIKELDWAKLGLMEQELAMSWAKMMKSNTAFDPTQHNWADLQNLEAIPEDARKRIIPAIGVATNEKAVEKLAEPLMETRKVSDNIESILSKVKSGRLSLKNRDLIEQESQALASSLRIAMTGPGSMSDSEREFLQDVVGNPGKLTDMILSRNVNKLQNIKGIMQRSLRANLKAYAITPFKDTRDALEGLSEEESEEKNYRLSQAQAISQYLATSKDLPADKRARAEQAFQLLLRQGGNK